MGNVERAHLQNLIILERKTGRTDLTQIFLWGFLTIFFNTAFRWKPSMKELQLHDIYLLENPLKLTCFGLKVFQIL